MSPAQIAPGRTYDLHGVAVHARGSDAAPLEAIDLRLRGFPAAGPASRAAIELEFIAGAECPPPDPGDGRPVYETPHGSLFYIPDAGLLHGRFGGVVLRCEPHEGRATLNAERFSGRDLYLATHPLSTVALMELCEHRGLFSLHAGCLADDRGRGVLLAGPSGAGKSTLALALAHAGMRFLSDDVLFLEPAGDRVHVRGFADTIGVTEATATLFPQLTALLADPPLPGFPKRLHRVEEMLGEPSVASAEPVALVFPRVEPDRESELRELAGGEALLRLTPDVLLTDPGATLAHLQAIAALLERVRCYELRSGRDLTRAAQLVAELLVT